MKKLILLLSLVLVGCSSDEITNIPLNSLRKICIEGVIYYNSHSITPAFKPDGTLYTCETQEVAIKETVVIK